ncbi:hypothetical protein ACE1TF_15815 [Geomicrobium sp. JSM 1781026]|uniref:hypothetical protein n=1 Tax=Geomicrobium sp. JSM 1781026 TaxID=3344580 RepID=UPI0035C0D783
MSSILVSYQWEWFIIAEISSWLSLLLFGALRYLWQRKNASILFLITFIGMTLFQAVLALVVYRETGEVSPFTIIITIFVLYACTFGISDFRRLDRWMRKKIGQLRGQDLLTPRDREHMRKQRDPRQIRRKDFLVTSVHVLIFLSVQVFFWSQGPVPVSSWGESLRDIGEWFSAGDYEQSPYASETVFAISSVWLIVVVIDVIYSASHLFSLGSRS